MGEYKRGNKSDVVARRKRRTGVVGWVEEWVRRWSPVRRDPREIPMEKGERSRPE